MSKKFYAVVFVLIMSVSLSGCHIPILNKEVTMPFFEKKPEEVISLMIDKMQDIKTVKYKSDIAVKMHIDPAKMEISSLSFLNSNANPQVLGESVSASGKASLNNIEYGVLPAPNAGNNMNMPMFGSGPMDIKYNISLSGATDQTDKINQQGETKFNLNLDFGGMEIKMNGEVKFIDQKIYFKIGQLPFPLSLIAGQFANQWYELDIEKMQELQEFGEIDLDDFDFAENKERLEKLEQKINKSIKDYKIINFDKRLKDEKIDNKKCYRYQVSLNKNNLDKLVKEFIKIFKEEFIDIKSKKIAGQGALDEIFNDPKFNSFLQKLSDIIKKAEGEIWIDKKDFYLCKAKFDFNMDFSGIEFDGEKMPNGALNINISGNLQYSDFNKPIKIEAPKDCKNLIDEIEKMIPKPIANKIDSSKNDSDNDGLTDEDEKIYGTDPKNPDTDSDGYSDGDEVKNGYNPNGEGKLDITSKISTKPSSDIKVLQTAIEMYIADNNGIIPNPTAINAWNGDGDSLKNILSLYLYSDELFKNLTEDWIYCWDFNSNKYMIAFGLKKDEKIAGDLDSDVFWRADQCIGSDDGKQIANPPNCADSNQGIIDDDINVSAYCVGSSAY